MDQPIRLAKKHHRTATRSMLAVGIAAIATVLSCFSVATGDDPPVAPEQEVRPSDAAASDGPGASIRVHGHWTIEVRNPDGTLAQRREFENAYVVSAFLPRILSRSLTVGSYRVHLLGPLSPQGPCSGSTCTLSENAGLNPPSVPATGPNANKLMLGGNVTVTNTSSINEVRTENTASTAGGAIAQATLTAATLNPAVAVSPGQQLFVTVAISFS